MLFNTFTFIFVFLPLTFAAFHLARRLSGPSLGVTALVGASFVFYAIWNPPMVALLGGSVGANYLLSELMRRRARSKLLLGFGIASNLAVLANFKYAVFVLSTIEPLVGSGLNISERVLPIGISFFTFQQIAYLVDVWRGIAPRVSFQKYALFVSFFPQLIAGPIVYHREILPQYDNPQMGRFAWENIAIGGSVFVFGLAQKVLLADSLAVPADKAFAAVSSGQQFLFLEAWAGALAFTFQIYFDFAGYSNMAIGLAAMFGIRLPVNFDAPYRASSMIDFWRRWHMTLSRFLRDFLYIPLGGNRKGIPRRYANLLATMVIGGLWHGAGWTFVAWGGLHGGYLIGNHGWRVLEARISWIPSLPRPVAMGVTFLLVVIAWVFFRAESFASAITMLQVMSAVDGITLPWGMPFKPELPGVQYGVHTQLRVLDTFPLILLAGIVALLPGANVVFGSWFPGLDNSTAKDSGQRQIWRPNLGWAVAAMLVGSISLLFVFARITPVQFVYFEF